MTATELERTREAWDAIARGYDEFVTPTEVRLANEALGRAGLRAGMRFLDVAAGSGGLSLPAARLGARVLATDISPTMLALLAARARDESLDNVDVRVMDGHELELEDDAFDLTASQFGVMLFPDLPRALAEMARVTRPGGRVLLVVYAAPTRIEFLGFFLGAIQAVVPGFAGLPADPPPLEFQASDPETLRERLAGAGLSSVRVEDAAEILELDSGRELWAWVLNSNPLAKEIVGGLGEEERAEVRRVLDAMLRERSGRDGPARITNPVHLGLGTA
jgi:ubiquinone/menaquinone biosynthesis C-methylase UbiE